MQLRAEVSEFFDRMDRDFDGRLSFGEFMGEETPLEKVFKNMDKDGDGTVSKEVTGTTEQLWSLIHKLELVLVLRQFRREICCIR